MLTLCLLICSVVIACEVNDVSELESESAGEAGEVTGGLAGGSAGESVSMSAGELAGDSASGGLAGESAGESTVTACAPDEEQWAAIAPIIEARCGLCHGESPQFGAPFALNSYELVAFDHADEVTSVLSEGTMPPAGQPSLSAEERMAMYQWLTCGEIGETPTPLPAGGFSSSRPVLDAPAEPPSGVDFFEVRAGGFRVPKRRDDRYECFTIAAPVNEERFIRRIETIVDDARVLHHVVVIPESGGREPNTHSKCDQDNPFSLIYGWAPGQGALQFDEGGIRLAPGQAITLQLHYNNSARYEDAIDDSGVRIYHGPVEGPEVAVLTLGPVGFEVPPKTRERVTGYCELPQDTTLIASFPHMHEKGAHFEQLVTRDWLGQDPSVDPVWEDVITLDGWSFESQYVYDSPMTFARGDLIKTSCIYENDSDEPLRFGENTADEMCFNFAYISPPISVSLCDQSTPPAQVYNIGECAPEEATSWSPPSVEISFEAGDERTLGESAPLEPGLYWIDEAIATIPADLVEQYRVDLIESGARGRGAVVWHEDQRVTLDLNSEMRLVALGLSFTERLDLSISGALSPHERPQDLPESEPDPLAGSFALSLTCGELESGQLWVNPDPIGSMTSGGWIEFPINFGPVSLFVRAHLSRAEQEVSP